MLELSKSQSDMEERRRSSKRDSSMSKESSKHLDFDELMTTCCAKFECPLKIMVKKDYYSDDFLRSLKQTTPISGKNKRLSTAYETQEPSDAATVDRPPHVSLTEENIIIITAVYDSNKLYEILIRDQNILPRVVLQVLGILAPLFPQLKKVTLKKCHLKGNTLHELQHFLPLCYITDICLDNSVLSDSNFAVLLDDPCHVRSLSLSSCQLYDKGCELIMSKLHYLKSAEPTLSVLNLSSNHITSIGAKSIGQALKTNRHLRYLNIADNCICDDGAEYILSAMLDFMLTTDEIKSKLLRRFKFLREREAVYSKYLANLYVKSIDDLTLPTIKSLSKKKTKKNSVLHDDGPYSARSKAETMSSEQQTVGEYNDPFSPEHMRFINGYPHCVGNMVLCHLNLTYNNLTYISVKKIHVVLIHQSLFKQVDQTGLVKVLIEGNLVPASCDLYKNISDLLIKNVYKFSQKCTEKIEKKKSRVSKMSKVSGRRTIATDVYLRLNS